MQRPTPPVWGPVLLALIAAVACFSYVTSTVETTSSVYTWTADRIGPPAPLVLAAQSPQSLSLRGPCSVATSEKPVDLLSTGTGGQGLTVRAQSGQVWMRYGGGATSAPLTANGDCTIELAYARGSNEAVLTAGDASTQLVLSQQRTGYESLPFRQFAITQLYAAPGFEAQVVTQPTTYSSSALRIVWLLIGLACALGLAVLLRRNYGTARQERMKPDWAVQDSVVAAVGVVALVVVPPRFDDGWVLTTVRQYADLGFFSNYYSIDAAAQPQGFWWTWIERLWLSPLGTPGFLLRLPVVIILVGTWWLLRRHVIDKLALSSKALWVAALVAATGLVGLQVTLRPEPVVAVLLAGALATVLRYSKTPEPWLLVVLGALSSAALALHQTGWCVILASAAALPQAWSWTKQNRAWFVIPSIFVICLSLLATLLMLGSNARLWLNSVRAFQQDSTTYQSFLAGGQRFANMLSRFDNPAVTFAAVGLLALAVLGFLVYARQMDPAARVVGIAAVLGILGLVLTNSKLVDHYATVVPAAAVLAAVVTDRLTQVGARVLAVLIVLLGIAAFARTGVWALGLERTEPLALGSWGPVCTAALLVVVGLVVFRQDRYPHGPATIALTCTAVLAVIAASLSVVPVVVEGLANRGSWFGQQLGAFQGRNCGFIDTTTVYEPQTTAFDEPVGDPDGSLQTTTPPDGAVVWAKGGVFDPIAVQLVNPEDVQETVLRPSPDIWTLVPAAQSVRWADPAVSVVTVDDPPSRPATEVLGQSPDAWYVEPGLALQAPCVKSASIRSGVLNEVQHSVGRPGWVGAGLVAVSRATWEAGCAQPNRPQQVQCVVDVRRDQVAPLQVEQISESVS